MSRGPGERGGVDFVGRRRELRGMMSQSRDSGSAPSGGGEELTDREYQVLEAVVRTYVETAEPAGSRTVARRHELGVSPATIRNTMSDLEAKGYLFHPHTSAGRIPTDTAYRLFVNRFVRPVPLSGSEQDQIAEELERLGGAGVERLVRRATRALGLLSQELGVAAAPRLDTATLERLDLVRLSSTKVLLVAEIQSGVVRTLYVDLNSEVPEDTLVALARVLNERLAGLTLAEIRESVSERLRNAATDPVADEILNIFVQSGTELFEPSGSSDESSIHLGHASVLASKPEFTSGERLKGLLKLTERRDLLAAVLGDRPHPGGGGLQITIGGENSHEELQDFTLVTAEYRLGSLKGVIGVIGPTRMPYEKVIAIVDYTSSMVNRILE
ncbi:MAG: heat-inducible transcription repressor HrcA [Gemmatimonadales bacterium]|nr:MAG: heat-inducible transcription repressor HrcA [Gemmatimonadales bacterium]